MRWSFEVPFEYLQQFDVDQDYLFVLSQYLVDKRYYDYVKNSSKLKILDNGANESEFVSMDYLLRKGKELGATILVLPDKQFDYHTTKKMLLNALENVKGIDDFRYMGVMQGETEEEALKLEDEIIETGKVDYIGLPFKLVMKFDERFLEEAVNRSSIPIHFLGLGSIEQVKKFKSHCNITSIDTSLPTNFAFLNSSIKEDERPPPGKIKLKEIERMSDVQLEQLKRNISYLKNI